MKVVRLVHQEFQVIRADQEKPVKKDHPGRQDRRERQDSQGHQVYLDFQEKEGFLGYLECRD